MMIALSHYISLTIVAAIGAAIGGIAAPMLADRLLKRKLRLWGEWFDRSAAGYADFAAREGRAPSASAKGEEGALGLWAEDALRLAAQGALDDARAAKVEELGLTDGREESRRAMRREVGKAAAAAKAAVKASLPKGGAA
jgi:hypothetical protein